MRKIIITILSASALSFSFVSPSAALPPVGFSTAPQVNSETPMDQTRLFCANRYTGRFLYWGPCGGYRPIVYNRPRVYCRSLYTGRFLHWGFC